MKNNSDFRFWNDTMALKYNPDTFHRCTPLPVRLLERARVSAVLAMADLKPGERVLEVGAGAGNVLERITIGEAVCLDLSIQMLNIAKTKRYLVPCSFIQAYGETLPFRDGSFDKIICTEVLEHVPDPGVVCAEICRVLAPAGRFVFSVPNEGFINTLKKTFFLTHMDKVLNRLGRYNFSKDMTDEWHLHSFDLAGVSTLMKRCFEVKSIRVFPFRGLPLRIIGMCCRRSDS